MNISEENFERLQKVLERFPGDSEQAINEVLRGEGDVMFQESIRKLMPVSGKTWNGKPAPAKTGNSLRSTHGNLSVTIRSTKKYQYLYFPNDGTNTRRHVGNQQFFPRGIETVESDVVDRCIENITKKIEEGV